jgi:hypothetical protein
MFILTKEGITAIVRTLMGYVYGFLLTTFAFDLPAETETALTVLFGTASLLRNGRGSATSWLSTKPHTTKSQPSQQPKDLRI